MNSVEQLITIEEISANQISGTEEDFWKKVTSILGEEMMY